MLRPLQSDQLERHHEAAVTRRHRWATEAMREYASILVSFLFHLVLMLVLALLMVQRGAGPGLGPVDIDAIPQQELDVTAHLEMAGDLDSQLVGPTATLFHTNPHQIPSPLAGAPAAKPLQQIDSWRRDGKILAQPIALPTGGGLGGRRPENRRQLALGSGGTQQSENAVELGLYWVALHQRQNGSWAMHFEGSAECRGACRNHPMEDIESPTAATGLALLSFLGAGYTHQNGKYQQPIERGIYFLRENQLDNGSFRGSGSFPMYGHGIATLALCEAIRMTQDRDLRPIAQRAVNFIVNAQHREGGWRYNPKEAGDVTVTSWQYMALYSAEKAGLDVPSTTRFDANRFLDRVQTEQGAYYGYMSPGADPSPTAMALLCRMYSGWNLYDARLAKGVKMLEEIGPSPNDVYYNFYATQVMRHYELGDWAGWNEKIREHLIATQARSGHETGSWFFTEKHALQAGRLYTTTLCVLTLEVYYRNLPLYGTVLTR
ncbi:MAG: prenyltransferase/squalene oxidase repeat-containing protein [Pirellulaceae bacterium]